MRVNSLILENFNGFDHRKFVFSPSFNLLVGDNASGKTSVLDALSIALGSWFLGIRGYASPPGIDPEEVRVVAHPHRDIYSFEKQFPVRIITRGLVMGREVEWTRELNREGGRTSSVGAKSISAVATEAERKVRSGEEITLPLICTYGTERLWFEATHRSPRKRGNTAPPNRLPSRLDGYRDCFDFTIQETALLDWVRAEVSASQQKYEETIAIRAFKRAVLACVEGANYLYYDERYKDIVIDIKNHGHQLFKNLSDGQRIVLTLVGDLVRRSTTLNPNLAEEILDKTPGVVLIDELDLHLHPKWQRRIIEDLKNAFPSIQFIATTHSPQLIGEAQPEQVILLAGKEASNPEQSYGMDSNWILRHVMGTNDRDAGVKDRLRKIEQLIEHLELPQAKQEIDQLRIEIGAHPDLVRLSARADRFAENSK